MSNEKLNEKCGSESIKSTFLNNGIIAWNLALINIKESASIGIAKK